MQDRPLNNREQFVMTGIVPEIPLKQKLESVSRLIDHHPDTVTSKPKRHRWGSVEVLSCSGGHRIERVSVKRGKELPAHYHQHRSEHWTVVEGEAEVLLGDDVLIVAPDDSLYIPAGTVHGLKTAGDSDVRFVAVHFGDTVSDADDMVKAG
jgi:mannose-6-phosphate isomerase-like protein (cupin superfamily)